MFFFKLSPKVSKIPFHLQSYTILAPDHVRKLSTQINGKFVVVLEVFRQHADRIALQPPLAAPEQSRLWLTQNAQFLAVCSKGRHHSMRQPPCLNRCASTRSPVNTCPGHVLGYHVSRPIYYKYIAPLYSSLEPVHRVHSLAHAVRPSLLLSGSLAGMFPHAFAARLLLLSTFLRCYKLLEIERLRIKVPFPVLCPRENGCISRSGRKASAWGRATQRARSGMNPRGCSPAWHNERSV
jgi:hypothetical protein